MTIITQHYYINKECGNIHHTFNSMFSEFAEMYDGNDDTNCIPWTEYYIEHFETQDGTVTEFYTE